MKFRKKYYKLIYWREYFYKKIDSFENFANYLTHKLIINKQFKFK